MARTRLRKPSHIMCEVRASLSPFARLLLIDLPSIADCEGRLLDRPKTIRAHCLPHDLVDAEPLLQEIADAGFIIRYEANGVKAIEIVNFAKEYNPHPEEASQGIPGPYPNKAVTSHEPVIAEPGLNRDKSRAGTEKAVKRRNKEEETRKRIKEQGSGSHAREDHEPPEPPRLPPHCPEPPPNLNTPLGVRTLWLWHEYKTKRREAYTGSRGWNSLFTLFADCSDEQFHKAFCQAESASHQGMFPPRSGGSNGTNGKQTRTEKNMSVILDAVREARESQGDNPQILYISPLTEGDQA